MTLFPTEFLLHTKDMKKYFHSIISLEDLVINTKVDHRSSCHLSSSRLTNTAEEWERDFAQQENWIRVSFLTANL